LGRSPDSARQRAGQAVLPPFLPATTEILSMPRYLIEREFPAGLHIPTNDAGQAVCRQVAENNAQAGVTWIHSYVTPDRKRTFCIYDGPSPEAIRRAALTNTLPITQITEVRVLDPYFYS
jgi:hypothetical protein